MSDPNSVTTGATTPTDEELLDFVAAVQAFDPYLDDIIGIPEAYGSRKEYFHSFSPVYAAQVLIHQTASSDEIKAAFASEDTPEATLDDVDFLATTLYGVETAHIEQNPNGSQTLIEKRYGVQTEGDDLSNPQVIYSEESAFRASPKDAWISSEDAITELSRKAVSLRMRGDHEAADAVLQQLWTLSREKIKLENVLRLKRGETVADYLHFFGVLGDIQKELDEPEPNE